MSWSSIVVASWHELYDRRVDDEREARYEDDDEEDNAYYRALMEYERQRHRERLSNVRGS